MHRLRLEGDDRPRRSGRRDLVRVQVRATGGCDEPLVLSLVSVRGKKLGLAGRSSVPEDRGTILGAPSSTVTSDRKTKSSTCRKAGALEGARIVWFR